MHAEPSPCPCHAYEGLSARHISGQIADDSLRNLIKHQDRSVPIFLVNDLEARGITEHGLDPCEGVEDLRDTERLWVFKGVLRSEALGCQALLHVGGCEEREVRVYGVLHFFYQYWLSSTKHKHYTQGKWRGK